MITTTEKIITVITNKCYTSVQMEPIERGKIEIKLESWKKKDAKYCT